MPKLVNDNVPQILPNFEYHSVEDDKEFFALLKTQLLDNVNKLFDQKDIDKKIDAYVDIFSGLEPINSVFVKIMGTDKLSEKMTARVKKVGKLDKRYVVETKADSQKEPEVTYDVESVVRFGAENEYPSMVLKRDGNEITKLLGKGKDSWDNAISWASLREPYKSNFLDLVRAVKEKDMYGKEE